MQHAACLDSSEVAIGERVYQQISVVAQCLAIRLDSRFLFGGSSRRISVTAILFSAVFLSADTLFN
jgi:hypothetical protein